MSLSFAFGGDTGSTYDDLKRRQALAQAMWLRGNQGQAKTAMEGLNSAAQSITGALLAKKLGGQIKGQQDEFDLLYKGALGGMGQPMGSAGYTPGPDEQIADDAMRAIGKPEMTGGRQEFIEAMMPHAMRVSQQTGLDPRLVIAQAAQETGWGRSAPGNNYFGIKSHGKPGGNTLATNEVINGQTVRVNDSFRGYRDMGDSVNGYASFLQENPRYRDMLNAPDLDSQLAALARSGYATDPNYARSVGSIARSIQLPQGGSQAVNPQLMAMMGDPRASAAQRNVLGMLLQQQMQAADPMRQLQMQNLQGQIDARNNPAPPKREIVTGADGYQYYTDDQTRVLPGVQAPPKPSSFIVTGEQATEYGLPNDGKAYQVTVDGNNVQAKAVGGGDVTVNNDLSSGKFEEAFAKGDAELIGTVSESGLAAQRNLGRIDKLEQLLNQSPTGLEGAAKLAAGEFGIDTDGLSEVQAAQALINSLVPEQRAPGSGPMSDADLALFKQSLPRIINQPGGNALILRTMRAIAQYDAEGAVIVQRLRAGEINRAQAFSALQSRQNPLDGFEVPGGGDDGWQNINGVKIRVKP